MKKKEVSQEKPKPEPQEIEELAETTKEAKLEEKPKEEPQEEEPTNEEEELTEEGVKEYFKNIAVSMNDLYARVERIEHNLRLDFPN